MAKKMWFALVLELVFVNVFGWGKVCHLIVLSIAYQNLDEEQQLS